MISSVFFLLTAVSCAAPMEALTDAQEATQQRPIYDSTMCIYIYIYYYIYTRSYYIYIYIHIYLASWRKTSRVVVLLFEYGGWVGWGGVG